jgi:copper chaperone CopZ
MGFDWHSQALHRSPRWRRRIASAPARKILYVQESIGAATRLTGSDDMATAYRSAAELCDAVVYSDAADRVLVEAAGKPALWLPFGVDTRLFRPDTPFLARQPRAFFRGKVEALGHASEYSDRRRLLEHLRARDLVELVPYLPGEVDPHRLADDFNRFQVALNLPSVFAGHPTRVLEGMACGCCVVTNRTGLAEVDGLFQGDTHLVYYSGAQELEAAVARVTADPTAAAVIAASGRRRVAERFDLRRLLAEVIDWAGRALPTDTLAGAAR